jgi:hypothetical protein
MESRTLALPTSYTRHPKKDRPCPNFSEVLSAVVVMPAGIAELWIVGYLLVIGVRSTRTTGVAEEKAPEEVRS